MPHKNMTYHVLSLRFEIDTCCSDKSDDNDILIDTINPYPLVFMNRLVLANNYISFYQGK